MIAFFDYDNGISETTSEVKGSSTNSLAPAPDLISYTKGRHTLLIRWSYEYYKYYGIRVTNNLTNSIEQLYKVDEINHCFKFNGNSVPSYCEEKIENLKSGTSYTVEIYCMSNSGVISSQSIMFSFWTYKWWQYLKPY